MTYCEKSHVIPFCGIVTPKGTEDGKYDYRVFVVLVLNSVPSEVGMQLLKKQPCPPPLSWEGRRWDVGLTLYPSPRGWDTPPPAFSKVKQMTWFSYFTDKNDSTFYSFLLPCSKWVRTDSSLWGMADWNDEFIFLLFESAQRSLRSGFREVGAGVEATYHSP